MEELAYIIFAAVSGQIGIMSIASDLFDRILQATQALFVSHAHKDHADARAISRMIEMGRQVIVPPGVGQCSDWDVHLIRPERHWKVSNKLVLGETQIAYRVFPGHQGAELLNNVGCRKKSNMKPSIS